MLTRSLIALLLTALGVFSWESWTGIEMRGWLVVAAFVFVYLTLGLVWRNRSRAPQDDESPMPISGPIRAFSVSGLAAVWTVTNTLALLNPWQLSQIRRQVRGNREASERAPASPAESQASTVLYSPPFEGEWLAINGGLTEEDSHSWDILAQRYAHDFVIANEELVRHSGSGSRVEHYFSYDQPILAAADGTVVAVESGIGNAPLVGWGVCDFLARSFIGNYVVIQHADSEFALYAHLVHGSVSVEPGSQVTRGQAIGRCGNSGHSSEPHLHFHVQDSADLFSGLGLPIRFGPVVVDGKDMEEQFLSGGMRVRNR